MCEIPTHLLSKNARSEFQSSKYFEPGLDKLSCLSFNRIGRVATRNYTPDITLKHIFLPNINTPNPHVSSDFLLKYRLHGKLHNAQRSYCETLIASTMHGVCKNDENIHCTVDFVINNIL